MEPTASMVVFITFPVPFPRRPIPHLMAWSGSNRIWFTSCTISWLLCENSRIQACIWGIKAVMFVIRVPMVLVSWGMTPNITRTRRPTIPIRVRSRLMGRASFSAAFVPFSFAFPKSFFSKKLMGTLMTKAMAPPSAKGDRMSQMVFITSITISNFHSAMTRNAVNTMSSRIFFMDKLFRSIVFSILF